MPQSAAFRTLPAGSGEGARHYCISGRLQQRVCRAVLMPKQTSIIKISVVGDACALTHAVFDVETELRSVSADPRNYTVVCDIKLHSVSHRLFRRVAAEVAIAG
jgi:hypothetical protein